MSIKDFVILPGSKPGTSVRLKTKTVREMQLEKVQLETENKEMEKKLQQLQSNMNREKEERKKLSAYHWKSGQAGPMTIQARILSQCKENWKKISSGKVKLQILKGQEPVKGPLKPKMGNAVAPKKCEVKGTPCGLSEMENELLDLPSESTCADLGNQNKGLLLNGAFNEEESAKSFQEALLQWRKGNGDHGEQLRAREVLPVESVGVGEVQTSAAVLKEPIHVEFQKEGLSYMEKLLLKKYRRTPVDQISDSSMKDSRPLQTLGVHQAVTGVEEDMMDDLAVEEVKRLWASVFRVEEPNPISESAESESSLKIEFLDDSHSTDLEEPSNCLVMETEAEGMKEEGKAEPLEQCARNPVSSEEISQEKVVVYNDLERNAMPKERIKAESGRRSLSSCGISEETSNPSELISNKHLLEPELQETSEESQELDSVCNRQSLALPVIRKLSAVLARRQKPVSTCYQGLEGFFVVGTNLGQGILGAHSSLCAASSPRDSSVPFPGDGQWVSERSLSDFADDSVVRGVLKSQLNRPLNGFKAQNKTSPLMGSWSSLPGPEKHDSLTFEDVTSSSRHLEETCRTTGDFHEELQLKDHNTVDIFGDWDGSQMDGEEEVLEDKQQVLALQ